MGILMADKPHIIVLGAGLAGLGAAYQLARRNLAKVTVLERSITVGGNAGSFEIAGIRVDYGSHRLHPACDPEILEDVRDLLGGDLLDRPRHGRIRLANRWIHFPLKPVDLAFKLPPNITMKSIADILSKLFPMNPTGLKDDSFASVLEKGLGKTICHEFYFPYASKIWGLHPEKLSPVQAKRRVSAGSTKKLIFKILSGVPGFRAPMNGRFYYPWKGFGQIADSLHKGSEELGVKFVLGAEIDSIKVDGNTVREIHYRKEGELISTGTDHLWSTIPLTNLMGYLYPSPPESIMRAAGNLNYRHMILVYLVIEQDHYSEYDAHYFPSQDIPITRLSEPKNYSNCIDPANLTVLCAELPCSPKDPEWVMEDDELEKLVSNCLDSAEIPIRAPIVKTMSRRIDYAYPVYDREYDKQFTRIDEWLDHKINLITFGRQGLFVHDNAHHALYMAYSAAKCLGDNGNFDRNQWQDFKHIFDTHVVED
jgi:protoporphyrinogen oxidase